MRTAVVRQAVNDDDEESTFKLIHVDGVPDELFDLQADSLEMADLLEKRPSLTQTLHKEQTRIANTLQRQKECVTTGHKVEIDDHLMQRLRSLGYLD